MDGPSDLGATPKAWAVFDQRGHHRPHHLGGGGGGPVPPAPSGHYNWSGKERDQLTQWCDR